MVTVADMNKDGQLDIFDLILIKLKIESISDSEGLSQILCKVENVL